ncbi:cryptochrome/photolyase family protein [Microvirga flavescens]|uniref:cryptochrome/photolyase family protein n=1 Tax=Microvirga flavescens TaxID=2249811 RepID=UPI000DD5760C|nr:deoxyribodipyrimidine photo-lyase [Microvirga flavescens]
MSRPVLVWFRDDYRVSDNPALTAALASGSPVLCFAIVDEVSPGLRPLGGAARWWLHGSLESLDQSLRALDSSLALFRGGSEELVERIAKETGAQSIFWNRRYGEAEIAIDSALKKLLANRGLEVRSFNGRLLNEPWEVMNKAGKPFQVFTPYFRAVMARGAPEAPLPAPSRLEAGSWPEPLRGLQVPLKSLALEPSRPNWAEGFSAIWERSETGAQKSLAAFLDNVLQGYAESRERPGVEGTSRLSPHLRFGEISPRQIWHAVMSASAAIGGITGDTEKFLSELVWREFCYVHLHQTPDLATRPHDPRFARFEWSKNEANLTAWQRGLTGYPIVDAGMRQLWRTGWMHNRVRMIVASFLVKHLLTGWRKGEAWFWDTLVDADPANNPFGWQWVAGCGLDAAPFYRIFNPITQGEKFDPNGDYVRAFVPELSRLPNAFIHKPWDAPSETLQAAGVELGKTYPKPIVNHAAARERALHAFQEIRQPG